MRLLLDTHTLLWWAHEPRKLSRAAFSHIGDGDNEVFISAVSAMEIAIKHRKGALEYETRLADHLIAEVTGRGFSLLAIGSNHAQLAGGLEWDNPDPWDRLLAAQARIEGLALVTKDRAFAKLDVPTLW